MLTTIDAASATDEDLLAVGLTITQVARLALLGTEQTQQLARVLKRLQMGNGDASVSVALMQAFLRWCERTGQLPL